MLMMLYSQIQTVPTGPSPPVASSLRVKSSPSVGSKCPTMSCSTRTVSTTPVGLYHTNHLTYKALHTGHPPYLAELLQYHKPARSTRSSASHSLSVTCHKLSFGSRAFRISALKIWNSLPHHILQSQTFSSLRRHLKTHYFQSVYPAH